MRTILRGGLAGLLAALMTSLLWFVDYGPGNSLHTVARWLMLDNKDAGRQVGFLLLLLLGGLIGLLFGLVIRAWRPTLGGFLGGGIVTGAIGWLVLVLFFGTLVFHGSLGFGDVLYTSAPWLIYGLVLGNLTFQLNTLRHPA